MIPHGVLDYYLSLDGSSPTAQTSSSNQTVMFFGNIESYKGLDVLIRAFALLPAELLARTQLLVAGSPNIDVAPLQKLAHDLGVEQRMVWKLGYVREEEVPQLFRSASIVALPYRAIDQSGVLMTAVAFGKAIVASRTGGFPEVITGWSPRNSGRTGQCVGAGRRSPGFVGEPGPQTSDGASDTSSGKN